MRAVEAGDLTVLEQDFLNLMNVLSDFERKFSIRKGFNLFEALNITRQEIRHSRFLAYLLGPNETHGLNDRFLRAILLAVLNENPDARVKRLSVALEDLSDASVYCERDHFDITVQIDAAGLAAIDLDVPALLTLRVRGDLQRPQLLELVRLDQLLGRLRIQQRQVVGIADVQEPGARVPRQAARHQVDGDQLGLRRARGHVDDQVLDSAVDDGLRLLRDQLVVPVDPELDGLAVLEEIPAEEQVVLFA